MKIALIHYRMMRTAGGLETRLRNYLREFTSLGHEVTLLMAQPRDLEIPEGVTLQRLPRGPLPKSLQPMVFNAALGGWMRRHQYDLSFSLGRTSHQNLVLNPGNHLGYLKAEGRSPGSLSDWAQIRLDRQAYQNSDYVLAASEMMKQETCDLYGIAPEKVKILLPPADVEKFRPMPEKQEVLRQQFGIAPDEIACAFVSASHGRKGMDLLVEVFKALQGTKFRLLVAGNPLPALASGLDNVAWVGHLSNTEELYNACDLSLLPAKYEPFGQVVTESILCGIPAFVSDRVGAGHYLHEAEGKILPWDDCEAWIEAIREFTPPGSPIGGDFASRYGLALADHVGKILGMG